MKNLALILALLMPGAASAQDTNPTLEEVMVGATAMATAANGYLFIAREADAWMCAVNITSRHFVALIRGDNVVAEETMPNSICVPASHFQNAME